MVFADRKKLIELSPDKIVPNPAQPRTEFSREALQSLADSIRENGVLQPVLVRRERDRYVLIAGERRWRASQMAGLSTVPAIVEDFTPRDSAALALVENIERCDLHFFEEAAAICALIRDRGMTQEEAARRLGMSQSAVANKIRLLRLSSEEQRLIAVNHLTERHARALLRISDPILRVQLLRKIVEQQLNVVQTETLIAETLAPQKTETPPEKPVRTFIAKDIRLFLNTLDRAVTSIRSAGIKTQVQKRETETYYECVVRIPKKGVSKPNSSTR